MKDWEEIIKFSEDEIYWVSSTGINFYEERKDYYKWVNGKITKITEQEFEKVKREKEHKNPIFCEELNRFELLDIEG